MQKLKSKYMRLVETIPEMGEGEMKENDGGGKFNQDIL
jgi:hypothetical protein